MLLFSTILDYMLIKDKDYRKAIKALDRAGYRVLDG